MGITNGQKVLNSTNAPHTWGFFYLIFTKLRMADVVHAIFTRINVPHTRNNNKAFSLEPIDL